MEQDGRLRFEGGEVVEETFLWRHACNGEQVASTWRQNILVRYREGCQKRHKLRDAQTSRPL